MIGDNLFKAEVTTIDKGVQINIGFGALPRMIMTEEEKAELMCLIQEEYKLPEILENITAYVNQCAKRRLEERTGKTKINMGAIVEAFSRMKEREGND